MGETITVFLMDGLPEERIKCTVGGRTEVVYKIPRNMLPGCKEGTGDIVKHLKQTGIYFLLNKGINGTDPMIYVGQARSRKNGEGILLRLLEHLKSEKEAYREDWTEAIAVTTWQDNWGATEISYLENKFTNLAKKAGRYKVANGNDPNPSNITEDMEATLEKVVQSVIITVGLLGHNVFEPKPTQKLQEAAAAGRKFAVEFNYKSDKIKARGIFTNDGFTVLKESEINPILSKSAPDSTKKARENNAGKILCNKLTDDILFTSPSAAASFVGGCALSGNVMWATEEGKSPADFLNES